MDRRTVQDNQHRRRQSLLKQRLSKEFRLPVIRSVAPQRYIGVSVYIAVLIILAVALILPRTARIRMTIYSMPSQAEIVLNGTRVGTTPVEVVVSRGINTIEAHKDQYSPYRVDVSLPMAVSNNDYNVERNTIGLYLVETHVEPTASDGKSRPITDRAQQLYNSIYEWSLTGVTGADYHRPPLIQQSIQALIADGSFSDAWRIVESAVYDIADAAALADWITATSVATAPILNPISIPVLIRMGQRMLLHNMDGIQYINKLLELSSVYRNNTEHIETQLSTVWLSGWYRYIIEAENSEQISVVLQPQSAVNIPTQIGIYARSSATLLGMFIEYLIETPHTDAHDAQTTTSILISQQPATIQHIIEYLSDTTSVDDINNLYQSYIAMIDSTLREHLLQNDILIEELALGLSLQSIEQYLVWVQELLPPPFQGYRVRLPYNHEVSLITAVSPTPLHTTPAIWEWSETTYRAQLNDRRITPSDVLSVTSRYEARSVYSILEDEVVDGVLPIDSHSPITGFRIVLEEPQ